VQAALHGDQKTLKSEIGSAQERGEFNRETVGELARAVAQREVHSAKGEAALRRLRTVRSCAAPLYEVLQERAERPDDVGAEAALILLEQNRVEPMRAVAAHKENGSGAWRALAARAALSPKHALLRREFFQDPDQRVRRAALHAALLVRDPHDLAELLEAARLDPDPLSRSLATRAAGAVGGKEVVSRLRDRWERAEHDVRLTIIEAWAMPGAFQAGGEQQLLRVAEGEPGEIGIAAAHALYRESREHRDTGVAVLARAVVDGTRSERRLAIQLAAFAEDPLKEAIKRAAKDTDVYVRLMAFARMLDDNTERAAALKALHVIAKSTEPAGLQALAALAAAGDAAVADALQKALSRKNSEERVLVARSLIRLGRYASVATLLADDDPDVRTRVACNVLMAETRAL
jgi:HEAT repeat protein